MDQCANGQGEDSEVAHSVTVIGFFETGSHYAILAGLELPVTLVPQLRSAAITGLQRSLRLWHAF